MPVPGGISVMKSSFRRPTLRSMPTESKAGCLYPNNARVMQEAMAKGFDNALVCDALGNVAETGTSTSSWRRTAWCIRRCRMAPS